MSDYISRQAAIDAMCWACGNDCDKSKFVYNAPQDEQVIMCPEHYALFTLPSAEPERKRGKWIQDGHHIQCNQCGISICDKDREGDVLPKKFCPNCGSYNGGEEDDI